MTYSAAFLVIGASLVQFCRYSSFTGMLVPPQLERLATETPATCSAAADRIMAELTAQRAGQLRLQNSIERMETMAANNTAAVIHGPAGGPHTGLACRAGPAEAPDRPASRLNRPCRSRHSCDRIRVLLDVAGERCVLGHVSVGMLGGIGLAFLC